MKTELSIKMKENSRERLISDKKENTGRSEDVY